MDESNSSKVIHYTTHHNWSWVVTEALQKLSGHANMALVHCPRFRDLPSQSSTTKSKAAYALFRLDIVANATYSNVSIGEVRTRSDIFGFLDPKDSLTRVAQLLDARNCMPNTLLIPWNWLASTTVDSGEQQVDDLRQSIINMLSAGPKLLKAPLGSGGFGLYFVYSCDDIEEIVRCHRIKAEEKAGFLQDLNNTFYGFNTASALAWSLQDVISGVRVRSSTTDSVGEGEVCDHACSGRSQIAAEIERRRCQVRAYVVMVNSELYLYSTYEVRLPCWNIDLDSTLATEYALYNSTTCSVNDSAPSSANDSQDNPGAESSTTGAKWSNELENEYCGQGHGRPYNEHRNKGQTERYLLSELPELRGSEAAVTECMVELFTKLKPVLQHRQRANVTASGTTAGQEGLGHIFDAAAILAALQDAQNRETITSQDLGTSTTHRAEIAIVGVDLVLSRGVSSTISPTNDVLSEPESSLFSAKIVEINNNPAMPAEGKNMSALYRDHLVSFVSGMMELAAGAVSAPFASRATVDVSDTPRFVKI